MNFFKIVVKEGMVVGEIGASITEPRTLHQSNRQGPLSRTTWLTNLRFKTSKALTHLKLSFEKSALGHLTYSWLGKEELYWVQSTT